MARLPTKIEVVRALFARSGNQCAFPGCTAALVNEKNKFIAQICHIEAAVSGGERFNPHQSDEERRAYENLILLCYPHHVETDDVGAYSVDRLKEIKASHEAMFEKNNFKIDESLLYKIVREMEEYWSKIADLNSRQHVAPEFSIEIDVHATYSHLVEQVESIVEDIYRYQGYLISSDKALYPDLLALMESFGVEISSFDEHREEIGPFRSRNWEVLNLGITNALSKIGVLMVQMEIKYLEEYLKLHGNDLLAKERMNTLRIEFEEMAISAGLVD